MRSVDIKQAQSSLSRLVEAIERKQEREIIITRNGRPVAKLVPLDASSGRSTISLAEDLFNIPDQTDPTSDETS